MTEAEETRLVVAALLDFQQRIDDILNLIGDRTRITDDEKHHLQALLTSLKGDLKSAAKTGTVRGERRPKGPVESAYFDCAIKQAAANLTVAVNSHPITSRWVDCLYGTRMEVSDPLQQLDVDQSQP